MIVEPFARVFYRSNIRNGPNSVSMLLNWLHNELREHEWAKADKRLCVIEGRHARLLLRLARLTARTWEHQVRETPLVFLRTSAWVTSGTAVLTCKCGTAQRQTDGCAHLFMNGAHRSLSNQTKEVKGGQSCRGRSRQTACQCYWQSDGWANTAGIHSPAFPLINMLFGCTWTCSKMLCLILSNAR